MCLAIPGKVVELLETRPPFTAAVVEFGGVRRQVSLACVPEATTGDYVLVHAGVAISRINATEAAKVLAALEQLDLDEDFEEEPVAHLAPDTRHPTPDT
jgi:hydrogenase expression/formation protein HypC